MRIWMETKKTMVMVTHSVEEAVYLGDRVVVLTARPAKVKSVVEIELERPRDRFAPKFIGLRAKILEMLREEVAKTLSMHVFRPR